jgi:hypothetical protein
MAKAPRPFSVTLTHTEAALLLPPSGKGGHQTLHKTLLAQLANGGLTITLDDAELGMLVPLYDSIWLRRISGPFEAGVSAGVDDPRQQIMTADLIGQAF